MRRTGWFLALVVLAGCGSVPAAVPTATPLPGVNVAATQTRTAELAERATLTAPTATSAAAQAQAPTTTPTAPATATAVPPRTPTASPAATSAAAAPTAAAATATRPTAPAAPTAAPQPAGAIPAGWQVYRGSADFPFVVAYPPDWTADDSLLPEQRIVFFHGPGDREDGERIDIEISEIGDGASIDVQRDEFFNRESAFCDAKGIEYTEHRQIAGATFAILGATCDASNTLSFMQVASGLKGGDEWNILMRTPYDRKEARLREVFDPMLASLNIYAQVP